MDNTKINIQHGGDIDLAIKKYGGQKKDWIDLSTGINRTSYPWQESVKVHLRDLPGSKLLMSLEEAASRAYKIAVDTETVAISGAQQIINLLPTHLKKYSSVAILGPTYNEYEKAFKSSNLRTNTVAEISNLSCNDIAIIVNPNNPTGKSLPKRSLTICQKK